MPRLLSLKNADPRSCSIEITICRWREVRYTDFLLVVERSTGEANCAVAPLWAYSLAEVYEIIKASMNYPAERRQQPIFQPMRVGRRFLLAPMEFNQPVEPGLIPIRLDPGRAFGRGDHPTTQLCLAALERHLPRNASVIDLGTGTGILSIAAARLGAGSILALDTEPEAVRVARANIVANDVAVQVRVEQGSLAELLSGQWGKAEASVVVVNILAQVIVNLFAGGLAQIVAPAGLLILSGVLQAQTPEIRACLRWHGLEQLAQEQQEGWVCLLARRT